MIDSLMAAYTAPNGPGASVLVIKDGVRDRHLHPARRDHCRERVRHQLSPLHRADDVRALLATGLDLVLVEAMPMTATRRNELLREPNSLSGPQGSTFVYAAALGRVYACRA